MSTWSIEHSPAAGGASTFATLPVWGISSAALTLRNWDTDELTLIRSSGTALLDDFPWAFRDKLILWRDGVRVFHGWVTQPTRGADPSAEAHTIRVAGPWWWLASTPMRDPLGYKDQVTTPTTITTPNGDVTVQMLTGVTWLTPSGDVVWTTWTDQSIYHMQGQIRRALYAALWAGAPIAMGTIGLSGRAPVQSSRNATCAAWLQSASRYEPLSLAWWDYSGTTPTFNCAPRSGVSAYTLPFTALEASQGVSFSPLYAQQAHAVRIRYWYDDASGSEIYMDDKAGDNSWPEGPGALVVSVELSSVEEAAEAWWEHIAARLYNALSTLAWSGTIQLTEDGAALPWLRPGRGLNISGGRTDWETMAALVQEITYSIAPETEDSLTLTLGAPEHLGVQDWLELSQLATASASAGPAPARDPNAPQPGTTGDLNGTNNPVTPAGEIVVETLGGTWTKRGFSDYEPTSGGGHDPTRRRLQEVWSGSVDCDNAVFTGSRTINASTGAETDATKCNGSAMTWDMYGNPACLWFSNTYGTHTETRTPSVKTVTYAGGNEYCTHSSAAWVRTLSNEDTEEAAWLRLLATSPEWTTSPNTAIRTVPATIASGQRRRMRFTARHNTGTVGSPVWVSGFSGLAVWARYRLAHHLSRRAVDEAGAATSDWADAGTVYSSAFVSSIAGVGGPSAATEFDAEPGYEYRLTSTDVEVY